MRKFSSKTKTRSLRKSTRSERIVRGLILTSILVVLLVFFRGGMGTIVSSIFLPVHAVTNWFSESSATIPTFFRNRNTLNNEIESLQSRLDESAGVRAAYEYVKSENERLRSLLDISKEDRIEAGVLLRPSDTPYDTILIDRGTRQGIVMDAPVYTTKDTLIGSVSAVFEQSALVTLITAPGRTSTAYVFGPDIYTEAVGEGGGVLKIGVPQGIALDVGDVVVLPSVKQGHFGSISHIETHESSPEQYGYLTNDTALQSIRYVRVGRNPIGSVSFEAAAATVEEMRETLFTVDVPKDILISTSTPTTTFERNDISTP